MLLSELIQKLQEGYDTYGDCLVVCQAELLAVDYNGETSWQAEAECDITGVLVHPSCNPRCLELEVAW